MFHALFSRLADIFPSFGLKLVLKTRRASEKRNGDLVWCGRDAFYVLGRDKAEVIFNVGNYFRCAHEGGGKSVSRFLVSFFLLR